MSDELLPEVEISSPGVPVTVADACETLIHRANEACAIARAMKEIARHKGTVCVDALMWLELQESLKDWEKALGAFQKAVREATGPVQ
jgi:hypothetical protein